MMFAGSGIALAVVAALVTMWRRQHQLAQQLDALRASLDQVRLDVAHLQDPHGRRSQRVRPRVVRRKRHLQLLQETAAAVDAGAAWVGGHRAATFAGVAAVVAALAVFTAVRADAVVCQLPDPKRSQALELQLPAKEVEPPAAGTVRQPGPTPAPPADAGAVGPDR